MADPALPSGFTLDNSFQPDTASPVVDHSEYVPHLQGLFDAGASAKQIKDYAAAQGVDTSKIVGLDQAIAYRDNGGKGAKIVSDTPASTASSNEPPPPPGFKLDDSFQSEPSGSGEITTHIPDRSTLDQIKHGVSYGSRAALEAAGSLVDTLDSPIRAGLNAAGLPVGTAEDLATRGANALGLDKPENSTEQTVSAFDKGASSGLLSAGVATPVAAAGGLTGTIGEALAAAPVANTVGSGAASAATDVAARNGVGPWGQLGIGLGAGVLGGGLASGFGAGVKAATTTAVENPVATAFKNQGVTASAADVNPGMRNLNAYFEASPGGGAVRRDMNTAYGQVENKVTALGGGTAQNPVGAGTKLQEAGQTYLDTSRTQKNALYSRAENLAGEATITPTATIKGIDDRIAKLSETPTANAADIKVLQNLRSDLVDEAGNPKPLSVQGMRDLRTAARSNANQATLAPDRTDAIVNEVAKNATDDITSQLKKTNPEAAAAYATADKFYGQRRDMIRQVVSKFMGPKDNPFSPERAASVMETMAKPGGNSAALQKILGTLSPEDQADLASTVASKLGRRSADEPFSPALFVSQVRKLSPEARVAFFGKDGAQAIDDLTTIAKAQKATASALNNSRSGQVLNYRQLFANAIGVVAGAHAAGTEGAVAGGAAMQAAGSVINAVGARLMTNPRFVKWAAGIPASTDPATFSTYVGKLTQVAAKNPVIANDIMNLQKALNDNLSIGSAAASGQQGQNKQERP